MLRWGIYIGFFWVILVAHADKKILYIAIKKRKKKKKLRKKYVHMLCNIKWIVGPLGVDSCKTFLSNSLYTLRIMLRIFYTTLQNKPSVLCKFWHGQEHMCIPFKPSDGDKNGKMVTVSSLFQLESIITTHICFTRISNGHKVEAGTVGGTRRTCCSNRAARRCVIPPITRSPRLRASGCWRTWWCMIFTYKWL